MSCIKRCRWFFAQVSNGNVIYCTFWSKCAEWIELTVQCQVLLLAHHRYAKHKYNWLYIFILLLLSIFHSIFIVSLLCVLLCVYILVVLFIVGDEVSVSKMYLIVLTYSSLWTVYLRRATPCTVNSKTVRSASVTAVRNAQNCEIGTNRTNFKYCIPYRCYPSSICVRIVHIPISYFVRCNCTAIFNILELALLWGVWTPRRDATLRYSRLRRRLLARSSKTPFYIDTDVILYFKQMSG